MMPNLFPVFDVPKVSEGIKRRAAEYPEGWLYDFATGDFVVDGAGRPVRCDGRTAWIQWCIKTAMTQRYAYLSYGRNLGTEIEEAMQTGKRSAIESALQRTLSEALMADPLGRTRYVRNFTFYWEQDELHVGMEVVGMNGLTGEITVDYAGGDEK